MCRAKLGARAALAVLAVALGACGGATSATSSAPGLSALLGAGNTLFEQRNYSGAAQLFEQAISKDPTSATAHYDLGAVYEAQHETGRALTQYARALSYDPNFVPAIYNQATIVASRNIPLAIFLYRRAIHIRPNSPTAYLNLGLLEHLQGTRPQAGADLRKALQLDPTLRSDIPASVAPDLWLAPPRPPSEPTAPVP